MEMEHTWAWMVLMAFTLGIRHGFDLDHLATIDAITRTVRSNPVLSKFVGLLFSLGHGIVVTLISLLIGSGLVQGHTPEWLEGFGSWISIICLLLFGMLNLWSVFQSPTSDMVPGGVKTCLAKKLMGKKFNAPVILLIGALFAFSFDTFSQVALFAISASLTQGWIFSGFLGVFFTFGMIVTDGLNGFLVSKLVVSADGMSIALSRGLGLAISLFSLAIGIMAILSLFAS